MTNSELPLSVQARQFRFLTSPSLSTIAVLEVDTEENPVRIAFDKKQLAELSNQAALAAAKVEAPPGTTSLFA
jgi:hypothetical protein